MNITSYISALHENLPALGRFSTPWDIVKNMEEIVASYIDQLQKDEYIVQGMAVIHLSARVDPSVQIKGPAYIGKNALIGPNAFLRNGVFLGEGSGVGFGSEVKATFICDHSGLGHLNYVGDSVIGSRVNLEAGAMIANYFNERAEKEISVLVDGEAVRTGMEKFGALIGDDVKIGANAVLSPGTILKPGTVVGRLELVK